MLYDPKWEQKTETKPIEPWRQQLLDAAALIEARGHCKHTRLSEGRFCVLGAISQVVTGNPWKLFSENEPCATFARHLGVRAPALWNNAPDRTAEDVIMALRECARS